MNYFSLLGWIANLGVVPLFSFAFFLFEPAFLSFSFLLILVCVVFEDIFKSLSYLNYIKFKALFLTLNFLLVKIIIGSSVVHATSHEKREDIFLAKGEQIEVSVEKLSSYSIGNPEVVKYKLIKNNSKLLIKGKMIGFSDLIVHGPTKKTFHIYVTSKKEQLKKMEIANSLKGSGIKIKALDTFITLEGEIKNLETFQIIKRLSKLHKKDLILNISLSSEFISKTIGEIYEILYQFNYEYVSCSTIDLDIQCLYILGQGNPSRIDILENKYAVDFQNIRSQFEQENFEIKLFIVSKEINTGNTRNSGIDSIQFNLEESLSNKYAKLNSGDVLLSNQDMNIEVVGSPTLATIPNSPFELQIGSEIPFQQKTQNETTIEWKFAGLKINGQLELKNDQFFLITKSQLTKGGVEGVSGPKNNTKIRIRLNKKYQVYSLNLKDKNESLRSAPWLDKVPFFKHLFESNQFLTSTKTITVFAEVIKKKK